MAPILTDCSWIGGESKWTVASTNRSYPKGALAFAFVEKEKCQVLTKILSLFFITVDLCNFTYKWGQDEGWQRPVVGEHLGTPCLNRAGCPSSLRRLCLSVCRAHHRLVPLGWFLLEIYLQAENWRTRCFLARGRNGDLGSLCASWRTDWAVSSVG